VIEADGGPWLVGPVDLPGDRLSPPIRLRWLQEWGGLELTIEALWSPWSETSSAELVALQAATRALDAAGFLVDP
jgi:hypothetical protein